MVADPELYGLMGISHGWGRILTVMSPRGIGAVLAALPARPGLRLEVRGGHLPQFHEIRDGALRQMIAEHGIELLDRPGWEERKRRFGNSIYL